MAVNTRELLSGSEDFQGSSDIHPGIVQVTLRDDLNTYLRRQNYSAAARTASHLYTHFPTMDHLKPVDKAQIDTALRGNISRNMVSGNHELVTRSAATYIRIFGEGYWNKRDHNKLVTAAENKVTGAETLYLAVPHWTDYVTISGQPPVLPRDHMRDITKALDGRMKEYASDRNFASLGEALTQRKILLGQSIPEVIYPH